jgi:protein-arginine kinase activator protein McsA
MENFEKIYLKSVAQANCQHKRITHNTQFSFSSNKVISVFSCADCFKTIEVTIGTISRDVYGIHAYAEKKRKELDKEGLTI